MSTEWQRKTIGEFCPFKYGKGLPERDRERGNFNVFSSAGLVGSHSVAYVNSPGVVIGRKGTVGSVTYSAAPFWPIDTSFYVEDQPKIRDIRFTYYLLKTLGLHLMNTDSAVPGLNRDNAHSVEILVPPLKVQRTIADFLYQLDDRITLLRETNATLEAIAQALFKSWFVDFDPVRANIARHSREGGNPDAMGSSEALDSRLRGNDRTVLDEATAQLFPDGFEESELGLVPRGWRVGQLGEELKIAYGKNLPTSKLLDAGYAVYGGNGQIGFSDKFLYESRQVLVACRGAASGKFNQSVPRSFVTNNSLVLESSGSTSLPFGYLKGCISSADLTPFVTGSAQPQVTIDNLKNFKLLVPTTSTLRVFESFSHSIEDKIEENNLQAQTLTTLRDTLLPRLISGQLRLPEVERMIKESAV